MSEQNSLKAQLDLLENQGLRRHLRSVVSEVGGVIFSNGKEYVNFASNDYLGLSHHPALIEAMAEGARQFGVGSGASRLVTGTWPVHEELEQKLAEIKGTQAALSFSSGFAMASSLIPTIVGMGDVVILDKLSHACLIDGAKMSRAELRVFPHNNLERLENLLKKTREKLAADKKILIVTEAIFSMDGDRAPLCEIVKLKEKYSALLLVDEAHSFGVLGENGAGLAKELGIDPLQIDFHMGTLSKAAGGSGGYVATRKEWKEWFINNARSFIFSTAPPPALAAMLIKSLEIISSQEGKELRQRCRDLGLRWLGKTPESTIFPVIIGESQKALDVSEKLKALGFWAPAIRYPTVARDAARLRLTITAAHNEAQVDALAQAIKGLAGEIS